MMPLRQDNLFDRIANFQALHAAARHAVKGKRKKPGAHVLRCDIYRYLDVVS